MLSTAHASRQAQEGLELPIALACEWWLTEASGFSSAAHLRAIPAAIEGGAEPMQPRQDPTTEALRKLGLTQPGMEETSTQMGRRLSSTRINTELVGRLKNVTDAAINELSVQVRSARILEAYDETDRDVALFELDTDRGEIRAVLSRNGQYSFFWKK
jgi:hypothetical protein